MRDLSAAAEWNNQQLNIAHCEWSDGKGSFAGRGELESGKQRRQIPDSQQSEFESFLRCFRRWRADGGRGISVAAAGRNFRLDKFWRNGRFKPNILDTLPLASSLTRKCHFLISPRIFRGTASRTLVRDLRVRHQTGQLRADLFDAPSDFRLNIESTISPEAVRPLVPPRQMNFCGNGSGNVRLQFG